MAPLDLLLSVTSSPWEGAFRIRGSENCHDLARVLRGLIDPTTACGELL